MPVTTNNLKTRETIDQLFLDRNNELEKLKTNLSLKRFYAVSEKIDKEKQALIKLLDLQTNRDKILSEFSFVLDPAYFEQKFLN